MKGIKLPEVITEEEMIKILNAESNHKLKLCYALGFYECMRVGEVIKLKSENINPQLKLIRIIQGKGHRDSDIPIAPEVMKGLKHLPFNFSKRTLQRKFKAIALKVLGKDMHFHQLRHSGVTHYLTAKKWGDLQVQRLARHSKLATTQIYAHINPQHLVEKMWE